MISVEKWSAPVTDSGRKNVPNRGKHPVHDVQQDETDDGRAEAQVVETPFRRHTAQPCTIHDKTICTAIMMTTVDVGIPANEERGPAVYRRGRCWPLSGGRGKRDDLPTAGRARRHSIAMRPTFSPRRSPCRRSEGSS